MYIDSWSQCRVGDHFIEDTYNEVYRITGFNGNWPEVKVVGYQMQTKNIESFGSTRTWDGDPSPLYDQPCIKVSGPNFIPERN